MNRLLFVIAIATAACGGDSDDTASALITMDEGGVLDVGDATITIPAGAVSADVEVTLSEGALSDFPALEGADDRVIVVDPPLSLSESAELVVRPQQDVPVGGSAQIRVFSDGVWISPDVSTTFIDGEINTSLPFLGTFVPVVFDPSDDS